MTSAPTGQGPHSFRALEGHRYMSLATFRRSGRAVPAPVWFALLDGRVHFFAGLRSGKIKRIRNDARVMDDAESGPADRALREEYGWRYRLFHLVLRLQRNPSKHVFLELRPADSRA